MNLSTSPSPQPSPEGEGVAYDPRRLGQTSPRTPSPSIPANPTPNPSKPTGHFLPLPPAGERRVEGSSRPSSLIGSWRARLLSCLLLGIALPTQAQWLKQGFSLTNGWNSIYLHVDTSHATLDQLIPKASTVPIEEIWLWTPNSAQIRDLTSPQSPTEPSYWAHWTKAGSPGDTLTRLHGNVACLVRTTANYHWELTGQPVAPAYRWTTSGLNFIGFPATTGSTGPSLNDYFDPAPELRNSGQFFSYFGGTSPSPKPITDLAGTPVNRGQAFWIQTENGQFNRYFAPFEIETPGASGLRFGSDAHPIHLRLRNVTRDALTVTLVRVHSEPPPVPTPPGTPPFQGQLPILLRGPEKGSLLNRSHEAIPLSQGQQKWTLTPRGEIGSEIELVLGVDHPQLIGNPGDLFASILRFTDSLGLAQIDVPASATVTPVAGLWVGNAVVSRVAHSLTPFAKATNEVAFTNVLVRLGLAESQDGYHYTWDKETGRILVFGGPDDMKLNGAYLKDGPQKTTPGAVARPYPLRLIVHHDGTTAHLLQKIHYGAGPAGEPLLATRENLLDPAKRASARRISAVHLPTSDANLPWPFIGQVQPGATLITTVTTSDDDPRSNPFIHQYHPDHDNLDPTFTTPAELGRESFIIHRRLALKFTPTSDDFEARTQAASTLTGDYSETVTFEGRAGSMRDFSADGAFEINRISDIAVLTTN